MKKVIAKNKYWFIAIAAALVFFGVWELAARIIGYSAILPTFTSVVAALGNLLISPKFYSAVAASLLRALIGFITALVLGTVIGVTAGKYKSLAAVMRPLNAFMRTVPVAAITLVFAIWVGSNVLPSLIGFLLIFPVIYEQACSGVESIPAELENVMDEAGADFPFRFRTVYLPMVMPRILSGISSTFGMNLKAVITAETLAFSVHSIGIQIYYSKTNFVTDAPVIFAWVIAAVFIAVALEALIKFAVRAVTGKLSESVTV